jgi:hypothetical protein
VNSPVHYDTILTVHPTGSQQEGGGMKIADTCELLPLAVAAEKCGLARTSLRKYAEQGKLEAVKLGRDWFTTEKAARKYLKGRVVEKIPKRYRKRLNVSR